ncbi:MAG: hypothetical protein LQ351_000894 [Letrouitia transgressa]|nr:MAG: hypothetical protein LQ351_000894 [Letrouitia transgressa]
MDSQGICRSICQACPLHCLVDPVALRPALKAVILSLLPGLEEETSEEFERTHQLLNQLKETISKSEIAGQGPVAASGNQYFWQCVFLATITCASRRQGGLAYLLRNLPSLAKTYDPKAPSRDCDGVIDNDDISPAIEAVTSPEPGLLIRCFAAGLRDEQLLVQRGFLDLLVSHLPLHSPVLQRKVNGEELGKLVAAAAAVVARREMTLNRRLWVWFLGPEDASTADQDAPASPEHSKANGITKTATESNPTEYFEQFGLEPLVFSILDMLKRDAMKVLDKTRPFKICLSLMDRWQIGGLVVPRIFLPAMESVRQYQGDAPTPDAFAEVLRSANVFFDGVESGLIWGQLTSSLLRCLEVQVLSSQTILNRLDLIVFVVTKFNVKVEEMLLSHLPMLAASVLIMAQKITLSVSKSEDRTLLELLSKLFKFVSQVLDMVPEKALRTNKSEKTVDKSLESENQKFLIDLETFYGDNQGAVEPNNSPRLTTVTGGILLLNAYQMTLHALRSETLPEYFEAELTVLDKLFHKLPAKGFLDSEAILSCVVQASERYRISAEGEVKFRDIAAIISLVEIFNTAFFSTGLLYDQRLRTIIPQLLEGIWDHLSPSRPRNNVEAVRCVWRVHALSVDPQLVEGCITTFMLREKPHLQASYPTIENARRFATLWTHSNASPGPYGRRSSLARTSRKLSSRVGKEKDSFLLERPLLLLLDSLNDTNTELYIFTSDWLRSLQNLQVIADFLLRRLRMSLGAQDSGTTSLLTQHVSFDKFDFQEALYCIETISNFAKSSSNDDWSIFNDQVPLADQSLSGQHTDSEASRATDRTQPDNNGNLKGQDYLIQACMTILDEKFDSSTGDVSGVLRLRQAAVALLEQIIVESHFDMNLGANIEAGAIVALSYSVKRPDILLQVPLMRIVFICLKRRYEDTNLPSNSNHRRIMSGDSSRDTARRSLSVEKATKGTFTRTMPSPPPALLDCLVLGISSQGVHHVLDHWVHFLNDCLPFYPSDGLQILMPMVECFSSTIRRVFRTLQAEFENVNSNDSRPSEPVAIIVTLLNGFEQVLARAHDRLIQTETSIEAMRTPEQVQGFFGNMVSGVFTPESSKSRPPTANNRFTVLLCFKDAVKVCYEIWSWGDNTSASSLRNLASQGSFNHTSLRIRNRTRRILEHMFAAEALECLESLIELWATLRLRKSDQEKGSIIINLLHVLDGSRPKNTMPAIFNALYSRTNPSALDPTRKSTLTSNLTEMVLAQFLVAYTQSLEDDAMDEIWTDCMTFLRDVLANPLPHRQILPKLLEFTSILGEKVDNTSFGEQRKMRRELGDIFVRQLTATFTSKPLSFPAETSSPDYKDETSDTSNPEEDSMPDDVVIILAKILPKFSKVLAGADRVAAASSIVSTQLLVPTLRSRSFPRNVSRSTLDIMSALSRFQEASKTWRKDVGDALNDPRLFCRHSHRLAEAGWLPVLRQWVLLDKERLPEFLSRISSPTSAGIMFGVGASSARSEADRKTQLNLRRAILLVMAASNDSFVVNLTAIQEKIVDLLTATAASSPSSATRAEIYILIRALILKISPVHLTSFWPIITAELHAAISSLTSQTSHDTYNVHSILQACKLLDIALVMAPDEFQLREWLFISDTIDAVYRPHGWDSIALVDEVSEELDMKAGIIQSASIPVTNSMSSGQRKPLLTSKTVAGVAKEDLINRVLRPFLRQLSINAFESTYSMATSDWQACFDDLLVDLFDDSTLV